MGSNPAPTVIEVGPRDTAMQAAFCAYVPQVFRRASFQRWTDWAGDLPNGPLPSTAPAQGALS